MSTKAPIIYYFKGKRIPKDMEYRFRDGKTTCSGPGPNNLTGGLLAAPFNTSHETIIDVKYYPKEQEWHSFEDFFIGFRKDIKPTDLLRDSHVPGYPVQMGKRGSWIIPVAHLDALNFSLPCFEVPMGKGQWQQQPEDQYAHLSVFAEKIYTAMDDKGGFSFDEDNLRTICCEMVAVNYNISDIECGLLQMLNTSAYMGICRAVIDQPGAQQILETLEGKKKISEESDTSSGQKE